MGQVFDAALRSLLHPLEAVGPALTKLVSYLEPWQWGLLLVGLWVLVRVTAPRLRG